LRRKSACGYPAETARLAGLIADARVRCAFVADRLGRDPHITMLVNNAGIGATAPLLESDEEIDP
jgi:NAD(P)-dependent dehydrogenase (short-subunit alcohol dehydrogenase family)